MCMTPRKQAPQVPAPAKGADFKQRMNARIGEKLLRVSAEKRAAKLAAEEAARVEGERQAVIKAQSDAAGANTAAIADRTVASEQAGAGYIGGDGPTVAVPTNPSGDPLDQTGGARKRKQQYGSGYNSGVSL